MATQTHPDIKRVLFSEDVIKQRVNELAEQINKEHEEMVKNRADKDSELIVIGILKGSFLFMADLVRRLTMPHRTEFMALSSYGEAGTKRRGIHLFRVA